MAEAHGGEGGKGKAEVVIHHRRKTVLRVEEQPCVSRRGVGSVLRGMIPAVVCPVGEVLYRRLEGRSDRSF